jgi:hypothetical protein
MEDPDDSTPEIFNYLWLYWVLKHHLPKDVVGEIIGKNGHRKFEINRIIDNKWTFDYVSNGESLKFMSFNLEYYHCYRSQKINCSCLFCKRKFNK